MKNTCPMEASQTIRRSFVENRSRLLDIAAWLDRIDRSARSEGAEEELLLQAFLTALGELRRPPPDGDSRVLRIQAILSDPTESPIEGTGGRKSALGAYTSGGGLRACC